MVSVRVVRPFSHNNENVYEGQWIEMEPLDAAVESHEGLVSLLHGNTYQTREMVAESPSSPVSAMTFASQEEAAQAPTEHVEQAPPKRRRGRPRKNPV